MQNVGYKVRIVALLATAAAVSAHACPETCSHASMPGHSPLLILLVMLASAALTRAAQYHFERT